MVIPRDQSKYITLDMIKFVGKMLGEDSKQRKRSHIIYYGRTIIRYKEFFYGIFIKRAHISMPNS